MSYPIYNLALASREVPLKNFIKQTSESIVEAKDEKKYNLEFEGTEAKLAYEEIISVKSQRKSLPRKCNSALKIQKSESKTSITNANTIVNDINILFKAVESGDKDFINKHFSSGNVNISDQFGWTPLMSAAYSGHIDIVSILLKLGANTKAKDKAGLTAIDLACKINRLDIVNLLKENSPKKNKSETTRNTKVRNESKCEETTLNKEGFYCDVCKIFFMESSRNKHETSTLHVFNTKPKLNNAFYGIPKQNKGYQMLLNNGWSEEGGLGPDGEGQKYPVKTVLKRDREGLGKSDKNVARVTHFHANDRNAVKFINRNKRKAMKIKDLKKKLSRDAAKTRTLRQALS